MKTFAVVYVPDMNAKTQTVREIKEIQNQIKGNIL